MQLKIKKQTEETITIETPKYYQSYYGSTVVKISDKGMTKVGNDIIVHFNYDEGSHFMSDLNELLEKGTEVQKEVFVDKLGTTLLTLQNIINEL